VAQLGARLDGIEEAVGSNPIGSTRILNRFLSYRFPGERFVMSKCHHHDLDTLMSGITPENRHGVIETGPCAGQEHHWNRCRARDDEVALQRTHKRTSRKKLALNPR